MFSCTSFEAQFTGKDEEFTERYQMLELFLQSRRLMIAVQPVTDWCQEIALPTERILVGVIAEPAFLLSLTTEATAILEFFGFEVIDPVGTKTYEDPPAG